MIDSFSFYKDQITAYKAQIKKLKKRLVLISTLRLLVFLLSATGIYFFFKQWEIAVLIGVMGTAVFLFLLGRFTDIKAKRDIAKAILKINKDEIEIALGNFHNRDSGTEFLDPLHDYSLDIDLFGRGSFYQFINRTVIKEGTQTLVKLLTANNIEYIIGRQSAISELSKKAEWRQHYSAVASLVHIETPAKAIIHWLKNYQSFLNSIFKWIPTVFSLLSLLIISLLLLQKIGVEIIGYWLLFGLVTTGLYLKRINTLAFNSDKVKDTFRQYAALLGKIEKETFSSELLQEQQQKIQSEHKKASTIFMELSKSLDALDNRNNLISAVLGNGFLLWDIGQSYRIERWISKYGHKVEDWFEVVSFFDAYNTLANFAFNHPDYIFPKIVDSGIVIVSEELGHPLLVAEKRVTSDLKIDREQFFIVTGANMAGKSTFLRTVSLHIVMANIGLPVCAKSSSYHPVKLITSMRTSDSLTDESSYFFSELTRLKLIVGKIADASYFIVLDEILKGTNSTDKAIGSRKFVEKLVASHATGIIATHDLSLCEIESELDEVKNYFFDAEIVNDELYFDYKLKKGICENMNASFLLKKMDII